MMSIYSIISFQLQLKAQDRIHKETVPGLWKETVASGLKKEIKIRKHDHYGGDFPEFFFSTPSSVHPKEDQIFEPPMDGDREKLQEKPPYCLEDLDYRTLWPVWQESLFFSSTFINYSPQVTLPVQVPAIKQPPEDWWLGWPPRHLKI